MNGASVMAPAALIFDPRFLGDPHASAAGLRVDTQMSIEPRFPSRYMSSTVQVERGQFGLVETWIMENAAGIIDSSARIGRQIAITRDR
jgi:hypothetical protein